MAKVTAACLIKATRLWTLWPSTSLRTPRSMFLGFFCEALSWRCSSESSSSELKLKMPAGFALGTSVELRPFRWTCFRLQPKQRPRTSVSNALLFGAGLCSPPRLLLPLPLWLHCAPARLLWLLQGKAILQQFFNESSLVVISWLETQSFGRFGQAFRYLPPWIRFCQSFAKRT